MTDILNLSIGKHIQDFLNSKQELAAIWMEQGIQTENERTRRLTKGQRIRIEDGEVCNVSPDHPATHLIIGCYGTVSSDFELEVEDLINHNKSKIEI